MVERYYRRYCSSNADDMSLFLRIYISGTFELPWRLGSSLSDIIILQLQRCVLGSERDYLSDDWTPLQVRLVACRYNAHTAVTLRPCF